MKKSLNIFVTILLYLLLALSIILSLKEYYPNLNDNRLALNELIDDDYKEWIAVESIDISEVDENVIGYLSVPLLNDNFYIDMPIKDGVELEILATSIGHFKGTPFIDGNICLVAHNSGTNEDGSYVGYFDKINKLKKGDEVIYKYQSSTYMYKVISNEIISEKDLSILNNTDKNLLTLITCLHGKSNRQYRYCVTSERV